jgi:enamine deaminase RidA (YjgF/YER057c/UK114 family)
MTANRNFTDQVLERLVVRGLALPKDLPKPAGLYEPFRLHNGTGYLAAQVPGYGPDGLTGRVGVELSVEQGRRAAERAALNALGRIHEALGGFDRLVGLLHVAGHVASADDFRDQPEVLDGASRLFVEVLLERGAHSRTAYPAPRLPKNISIELEITFAYATAS